jgi:benzil reductase ((S)-benzoin forming)
MTPMNAFDTVPPMVILSGPTRGLGRALFSQLVSQAYPTVGLGRDLTRIADVAKSASEQVELVEVDLGGDFDTLESALTLLRRIVQSTSRGPLVFISNASIIEPIGQAVDLALPCLERVLRINCLAPLIVANTLADIARAQHRPLLVLDVSSGAACRPIRGWQAYCTSKAAYKMALDVLAVENSHVKVVHFDPGVMDTSMQQLIRAQQEADMPEVAAFHAYKTEGLLKAPVTVAAELILLMKRQLP